jgi:ureidoacrylate peracid hydrolase
LCHDRIPLLNRSKISGRDVEVPMWIADRGREIEFPTLIDPNTTALVVIDVQNDFCDQNGAFGRSGRDNSHMPSLAAALHRILAEARNRQVLTIFVRATYDREVTSRALAQNRRRLGLLDSLCLEGTWGADWFGGIAPIGAPNEAVLTKHRFDAFQGTPLDLYLRSNGIRTVIVTGVVTSGCVESTVRDAFFLDYRVVVPRDGVADGRQDYHDAAIAVMTRAFATMTTIDEVVTAWQQSNAPIEPSWRPEVRRDRASRSRDAEGLVLIDLVNLDSGRAVAAKHLAACARESGVPVFDVRSVDLAHGRSPWVDSDVVTETPPPQSNKTTNSNGTPPSNGASSPAWMPIDKMRRSAFADTRLNLLLRTNEIQHLTIAGADAVAGGLAATVLDALDADYAVAVALDACTDIGWTERTWSGVRLDTSADIGARWSARATQPRGARAESRAPLP